MSHRGTIKKSSTIQLDESNLPMDQEDQNKINPIDQAEDLPLQAQPKKRTLEATKSNLPPVACVIYALVSTGARGKVDLVALHEIPLLRRKLRLQDPSCQMPEVLAQWEGKERERYKTALDIRREYERLAEIYRIDKPNGAEGEKIDILAEVYGPNTRELLASMRRIKQGYDQIKRSLRPDEVISDEQMAELVGLADPDFYMQDDMSSADAFFGATTSPRSTGLSREIASA